VVVPDVPLFYFIIKKPPSVTICSHNTDNFLYELYVTTLNKCVILAKYWL